MGKTPHAVRVLQEPPLCEKHGIHATDLEDFSDESIDVIHDELIMRRHLASAGARPLSRFPLNDDRHTLREDRV